MDRFNSILEKLQVYAETEQYPMHMPGHKRNAALGVSVQDVFRIDLTEIPGFDDLHHPEGMIRASLDETRAAYGSFESFYSVNGSTACVLSALGAAAGRNGRVLAAENRHWSVDNAAELFSLSVQYIAPEQIAALDVCGGISPQKLEAVLQQAAGKEETRIQAVLIVSPTYEGVVSDVASIAEICHRYGALLLVDEAHGAHFHYSSAFPQEAGSCGADIVIESVHKTLPSMTQTAIMHVMKPDAALRDRVKHYLDIFVSSSPSYVLLASIDACLRRMRSEDMQAQLAQYLVWLEALRARLRGMKCLKLLDRTHEAVQGGAHAVFDVDSSRITVCTGGYLSGAALSERLASQYGIVLEKVTEHYVIAISTVCDTKEGLERFGNALMEIDHDLLSHG